MGIFYRSTGSSAQRAVVAPAVAPGGDRKGIAIAPHEGGVAYEQNVQEVDTGGSPGADKFSWGRLAFAAGLLAVVFVGGVYTAHDDKLADWSKLLLHSFELLLGALVGLITGEAARK